MFVALLLGAGETLASLPAAEGDEPRFLPGLPELQVEHFDTPADLIRDAYRRYELLAARSGAEVRFELSGFQTLYPADYDDHLMTDIRTFGGGWTLRAVMRRVIEPDLEIDEYRYEPFWEQQPSWLEHSFPHVVGMSVAAVFAGSILDVPPPLAITTYTVEATFDGRSRRYQAAFYLEPGPDLQFTVQDHVTQGLHYVYRHLSGLRDTEPVRRQKPEGFREEAIWSAKRCLSQTVDLPGFQGNGDQNSLQHSSGRHSGVSALSMACTGCATAARFSSPTPAAAPTPSPPTCTC